MFVLFYASKKIGTALLTAITVTSKTITYYFSARKNPEIPQCVGQYARANNATSIQSRHETHPNLHEAKELTETTTAHYPI